MAKRKKTVLGELERVRMIGPRMAEILYDEHNIRSVEDLINFADSDDLTVLPGVGKKKARTILSSAKRLASANGKARQDKKKEDKKEEKKKDKKDKTTAAARANGRAPSTPETRRSRPSTPPSSTAQLASSAAGSTPTTPVSPSYGTTKTTAKTPAAHTRELRRRFIDTLRCPACGNDSFDVDSTTLTCQACQRQFNLQNGIADLAPPSAPSRSMTQKLMESRFYAQFYEEFMRPRLTGVVSDRSMREEYRLAADFLDFGDDIRLLDVGCGTANFTRYFAQRIGLAEAPSDDDSLPLVVGMDLSWPMLENGRRNIRQENLDGKVFLLRGDASRIPVRRGSFNRLHCAGTLHLMDDIDEGLRNFARVLEPDGVCVIGTFILGSGILRRMVKRVAEFPTRFHWFSRDELHKRVERAGFEVLNDSISGDAITLKARRI